MPRHYDLRNPRRAKTHNPESLEVTVLGVPFKVWGHVTESNRFMADLVEAGDYVADWDREGCRAALKIVLLQVTGQEMVSVGVNKIVWMDL